MTEKLYANYRKWCQKECTAQEGIIVGADLSQEWLLPWWHSHYRVHNAFPIAFVDFGMSDEMKKWCRSHGELIPLYVADIFVTEKSEMDPAFAAALEKAFGKEFWSLRNAWFKKPLAFLQTPFRKSLWIDLDCQIRGPLKPIFDLCNEDLAIAIDLSIDASGGIPVYNSGVVAFKKGLPVIEKWADDCFERNHAYRADQDILNAIIQEQNIPIAEIPPIYNWSRCKEENPHAVILHWHGPQGKATISHQIAMSSLDILLK